MNYLIIILIVFVFLKNKSGGVNNLLSGINFNDVSPLLNLLLDSELVNGVNLNSIESLLNGKLNFSEILPLITSIMGAFNKTPNSTASFTDKVDGLEPIKDLFLGEFSIAIENYFEN